MLILALGWLEARWWRVARRLAELERVLMTRPMPLGQFREPEPGSYVLSDAEAAQVEADLLVESRGRALFRGARGWRGCKSS